MRARLLLGSLFALLVLAPLGIGAYPLAVLILILHYAYLGIAWNVMMGFAGLLSLGHALYVGLGAYVAAALYASFGVPALIGAIPAAIVAIFVMIMAVVVTVVAWFAILFTGKHPRGMFDAVLKVHRYIVQLNSYVLLMTDDYPKYGS